MTIVGCDFHPSWQQIGVFDTETGEITEHKLVNGNGEAERFYRQLPVGSRIGMEACGNSQWFIDRLQQMGHEVWIGDAAQIRASYVRKQENARRTCQHILKLLLEERFPRLWVPDREQRNLRQLLIHRHKLVEIRTRVQNGLQHLMLNQGVQKKHRLWSQAGQKALRDLPLAGWTARRREHTQMDIMARWHPACAASSNSADLLVEAGQQMVDAADRAMYASKRAGKDRVTCWPV